MKRDLVGPEMCELMAAAEQEMPSANSNGSPAAGERVRIFVVVVVCEDVHAVSTEGFFNL